MGYKPAEAYDLLGHELAYILDGFYGRLKREREGRAWLATHVAYAYRAETIPLPHELLGEEDPDIERRTRKREEQQARAHEILGIVAPKSEESPDQVLARFGVTGGTV